ncbi:uncharacterized protein CCOS01_16980 [Colletotrichum costaricense]|uniref:Protein kinase domain-containing protein n=1 Tax=Colletotrichum costaricense TaxID=1209916 RepID=A0AAI9YES0_9PEZI|nr:uncharacterized protein CCOS01_16980 [Colletotrichum costaricense]KAK1503905.1 hypothetical protein CCOS01_16980 [Colletotrichum costaricense]
MFLQQFSGCARFNRFANGQNIRMMSTVIGGSGRSYVMRQVLSYGGHDQIPIIFKAESQHESFIVKRVPRTFYDLSLRLAAEFASSRRLRMHIDCNLEEGVLIYPYYRSTLLSLIQDDDSEDSLPITERKKILRGTGEAIQELHTKGWIHCAPKELFEQISDEHWRHALAGASAIAENEVKQQPGLRSESNEQSTD